MCRIFGIGGALNEVRGKISLSLGCLYTNENIIKSSTFYLPPWILHTVLLKGHKAKTVGKHQYV